MTPNEFIIELSERLSPDEMNRTCSISIGQAADTLTIITEGIKNNPKRNIHIEGWVGHKRLAVCGIVMTEEGKIQRK